MKRYRSLSAPFVNEVGLLLPPDGLAYRVVARPEGDGAVPGLDLTILVLEAGLDQEDAAIYVYDSFEFATWS